MCFKTWLSMKVLTLHSGFSKADFVLQLGG